MALTRFIHFRPGRDHAAPKRVRPSYRSRPGVRRGIAAMLAMLFLVLISTLAVGFYGATNSSVQMVNNEVRAGEALIAAESGMEFIRYHLKNVSVPYGTTQSNLFAKLAEDLEYRMNGTPNLSGGTIYASDAQKIIRVPADPSGYVSLDGSGRYFRITISMQGELIVVKATGKYQDMTSGNLQARAVQLQYGPAQNASHVFDYGVASKGKITTAGSSRIKGATDAKKGSILSTNMTDPTPVYIAGKEVSGDISIVNPVGNVFVGAGVNVGGTTDRNIIFADPPVGKVHKGVPAPEFPTIDNSVFMPFVTKPDGTLNYYDPTTMGDELVNCVIPANHPWGSFTGKKTVKGVLYIEAPNTVTFRGGVDITGVIITPNTTPSNIINNVIDFSGNVNSQPVTALPLNDSRFDGLRELKGAFILAPTFHTKMSGSFATINGSILTGKLSMTGNAGGTVLGTVVNLMDTGLTLNGSSEIIIASTGTTNYPPGVYFSNHYAPLGDTYKEVHPW